MKLKYRGRGTGEEREACSSLPPSSLTFDSFEILEYNEFSYFLKTILCFFFALLLVEPVLCSCTVGHITVCDSRHDIDILLCTQTSWAQVGS